MSRSTKLMSTTLKESEQSEVGQALKKYTKQVP